MSVESATLHMLCGKVAAGKSTLAATLSKAPRTLLISEDDWLSSLYPSEIKTLDDYVRCSGRFRAAMGPHIESLLRLGVSVVLDFPANTLARRQWLRSLFENAGVAHELHFLNVSDDMCKTRLRDRNASGAHAFQTSDAEFDLLTSHFVPPQDDEDFYVIHHH